MGIQESQLVPLRAFGYTEAEARFLYLVATHPGYFTVRQFLDFAKAKSGKRNARLVETYKEGVSYATGTRFQLPEIAVAFTPALYSLLPTPEIVVPCLRATHEIGRAAVQGAQIARLPSLRRHASDMIGGTSRRRKPCSFWAPERMLKACHFMLHIRGTSVASSLRVTPDQISTT
jgi:hypothetical protein